MADDALNRIEPPAGQTGRAGDVPEPLRRRYLTDAQNGPGLGFYVDARVPQPAFRDHGRRLSTDHNDPDVIRDLVAIAAHRGWTTIDVRGQTAFRREAWAAARAEGLEVRGYRPTDRDLQELALRPQRAQEHHRPHQPGPTPAPSPTPPTATGPRLRLQIVEAIVKDRIVDPAVQDRVLAAARGRIADWLERGANFGAARDRRRPEPSRPDRGR